MNGVIAGITLRQLLSRRRTLLLLLLGGVLVLVAGIFRLAGEEARAMAFTSGLLDNLGVRTLMPLVALLFGTGAIGAEIEDGTAIFLLAKPLSRRTVVLTKLVIAAACSILLTCGPMLLAEPTIAGTALDGGLLTVRTTDFGAFSRALSGIARRHAISLHELLPTDESLESVFSYLVRR